MVILREYQKEDVHKMLQPMNIFNINDMGLGKTIETLSVIDSLLSENPNAQILIVCLAPLIANWYEEIINWGISKDKVIKVTGTTGQRLKKLETKANVHIVNNEMMRYLATVAEKGSQKKDIKDNLSKKYDLVVVDEFHNFSNREAAQSIGLLNLSRKCKKVIGLTGTPIRGKADEIWHLLHILYPNEYSSYWKFVTKYCETQPSRYSRMGDIVGFKDIEGLFKELSPFTIRRKKSDVLKELPEKIYKAIYVELTKAQKEVYERLKNEFLIVLKESLKNKEDIREYELEDESEGSLQYVQKISTVIAAEIKLRLLCLDLQLVGGVSSGDKTSIVVDLVNNNTNQTVIMTSFRSYANILYYALLAESIPVGLYTGSKREDREEHMKKFKSGEFKAIVCTIRAGGVGLNMQNADTIIFTDQDYSPKINEQAEDRIARIGQKNVPNIINLIAKDTIEEKIYQIVKDKDQMINKLMMYKKWFDLE